jgi:cytidylate kinase
MLQWRVVKPLVIAIDGPAGAGKGTLARAVASALGFRHVDTGAMYRAVAWLATERQVSLDDEAAVARMAASSALDQRDGVIIIDGHDVTRAIRTPEIDQASARVARLPAVRGALVARQRALGQGGGVVMEGRDIGTVVFPDAVLKVYLDASAEERARRRSTDAAHSGGQRETVAGIKTEMAARDKSDSTRDVAPLAVAKDAVYIDTTSMAIDDVVKQVMALVRERNLGPGLDARAR